MTKEDVLKQLQKHKSYLQKQYGVQKIGLFGSYALNKETQESDIDIVVEFKEYDFQKVAALWDFLENLYGKRVDLVRSYAKKRSSLVETIFQKAIFV